MKTLEKGYAGKERKLTIGDWMSEFTEYLKKELAIKELDVKTYSPLVLAYMGDAVFDIIIRTMVVSEGNAPVNKLHKRTSALVKAHSQAEMVKSIETYLTEEEMAVFKRGRNAKSATVAKNASVTEYRHATGFESLIGYLYLKEDYKRIVDLIKLGLENKGIGD